MPTYLSLVVNMSLVDGELSKYKEALEQRYPGYKQTRYMAWTLGWRDTSEQSQFSNYLASFIAYLVDDSSSVILDFSYADK